MTRKPELYSQLTGLPNDDAAALRHSLELAWASNRERDACIRGLTEQRDRFEVLLDEACERIADMLRQDDGEAFFEAEKFLKRECRELYDAIGLPADPLPDFPEPTLLDRACGYIVGLLIRKPRP